MPEKKIKIELELDLVLNQKIEIIAKAFGWIPEKFIESSLEKDVKYIQDTIERNEINDLQEEYNTEINLEILQKLLLLNEVIVSNDKISKREKSREYVISIPSDLYNDLTKLCKINNLNVNHKIINILRNVVYSAELTEEKNGSKHVYNF